MYAKDLWWKPFDTHIKLKRKLKMASMILLNEDELLSKYVEVGHEKCSDVKLTRLMMMWTMECIHVPI